MKTSVTALALSTLILTATSVGMGWNVQAGQHKHATAKAPVIAPAAVTAKTNTPDADLMAALGDEFVSSCSEQHKGCSKAWHDLDSIAVKEKL